MCTCYHASLLETWLGFLFNAIWQDINVHTNDSCAAHLFPAWLPSAHHRGSSWRPEVVASATAGRALRIDIKECIFNDGMSEASHTL